MRFYRSGIDSTIDFILRPLSAFTQSFSAAAELARRFIDDRAQTVLAEYPEKFFVHIRLLMWPQNKINGLMNAVHHIGDI